MKFTVERNWIDVLGHIWMPNCQAAQRIELSKSDVENIRAADRGEMRDNIEFWLSLHTGDFQSVDDFNAVIGEETFAWQNDDNEMLFNDCMYPSED